VAADVERAADLLESGLRERWMGAGPASTT
jgi:hypothetical protein